MSSVASKVTAVGLESNFMPPLIDAGDPLLCLIKLAGSPADLNSYRVPHFACQALNSLLMQAKCRGARK